MFGEMVVVAVIAPTIVCVLAAVSSLSLFFLRSVAVALVAPKNLLCLCSSYCKRYVFCSPVLCFYYRNLSVFLPRCWFGLSPNERGRSIRDSRLAVVDSFAMEAASNMHTCFYRTGYDIAMPLAPKKVFHHLAEITPLEREYFLTFKVRLSC